MPVNHKGVEFTARATAGQFRRAGFVIDPEGTDDSATTGFEVLSTHTDEYSAPEFEKAKKRGDAFTKDKA